MPPGSAAISYRLAPAPPRLTFIVSVGSPSPSSPLRSHFILGMLQLSKKKKNILSLWGAHAAGENREHVCGAEGFVETQRGSRWSWRGPGKTRVSVARWGATRGGPRRGI